MKTIIINCDVCKKTLTERDTKQCVQVRGITSGLVDNSNTAWTILAEWQHVCADCMLILIRKIKAAGVDTSVMRNEI